MNNAQLKQSITNLRHLRFPLTPYQLFSPVSTVFLDNLTYEEQLLGLYKLYNEQVTAINQISSAITELQQYVDKIPELEDAIKTLQVQLLNAITTLTNAINTGDANTLKAAKKYTDDEIAKIQPGGGGGGSTLNAGITAGRYDAMGLAAVGYDDMNITAREYDEQAQIIFFGDLSTVYMQFKSSVTADALENVFDLRAPPIERGRRYQIEISLGNFSLNGNNPAKLEIVGSNTLGNTLPITVPNGGSATVVGIFNVVPTAVRVMSGEEVITGQNAYIKIKPLGEA